MNLKNLLALKAKDPRKDSDYNPEQLADGKKVEKEHTSDPTIAKVIDKTHLDEDKDYYKKLDIMENTSLSRLKSLKKCMLTSSQSLKHS